MPTSEPLTTGGHSLHRGSAMSSEVENVKTESKGDRFRQWIDAADFEAPARSASGAWIRLLAWAASLSLLAWVVNGVVGPLAEERNRSAFGPDAYDGYRYGMNAETRKAIFDELASAERAERHRAIEQNTWQGDLWSREDDRGYQELTLARALSTKYGVSLTQVYLVLDEAIREKWRGPDGEPLPATTPPLRPRSRW